MHISPAELLILLLIVTAGARIAQRSIRRRSSRALRRLAQEWGMNFGAVDTLRLTQRVGRGLPIPGAASVIVENVIYGVVGERYRYIFTVEYTAGVIGPKRRVLRAATFCEPRERGRGEARTPVVLAPAELTLMEQYRYLSPRASAPP